MYHKTPTNQPIHNRKACLVISLTKYFRIIHQNIIIMLLDFSSYQNQNSYQNLIDLNVTE